MKKLLLLFTMLITFTAKSQTSVYHPFPESNAVWNVDYTCCWGSSCQFYPHEVQYSYTFGSDTSINGYTYHQLVRPYVLVVYNCLPQQFTVGYIGGIRQDTSLRKVFFVPPGSLSEVLLYDFNLQVNDTVKGYLLYSHGDGPVIANIDSIFLDGNYRKRWEFHWWFGDIGYLVEGMGSSLGLLEDIFQNFDAPITSLLCFNQDQQTLYPDSASACQLIDAVSDYSSADLSLSISPNPFHISTELQLPPEFENAEMNIYNPLGILIDTEKIFQKSSFHFSRKDLTNGVYFIQLLNDKGLAANGKLIID